MEAIVYIKGKKRNYLSWIRNSKNYQLRACNCSACWFCYFYQLWDFERYDWGNLPLRVLPPLSPEKYSDLSLRSNWIIQP